MTSETLQGTLERITFQNPQNGFLVGRFLCDNDRHAVTVRGNLFQVHEGESLKLVGSWEDHPRYGQQFLVESYQPLEPTSLEGMERYLAATLSGVGEALAKRIVKTFGAQTFQILDRQPELLLEVPRFPRKALAQVQAVWQEHRAARDALVFLHSLGVSPGLADRVFRAYGLATIEAVKANPYRLALEVQGVGFRTADALGGKLGVARNAPERLDAGLLHVLEEVSAEGHTGYPQPLLLQRGAQMLEVAQDLVDSALQRLLADGLLKGLSTQGAPGADAAGGPENMLVFRPRMFRAEEGLVAHLRRIQAGQPLTRVKGLEAILTGLEQRLGITLAPAQRSAIQAALDCKLLIITGGPGTGKTTIVRFILGLVEGVMGQVDLAAPTGKAAKRLTETTGKPAVTIHRLLEAGQRGFARNGQHPLETELLIVDEVSMIDTPLMEALLAA
ncbi:MAG TPA: AAA family ATPase, partial [bacterium]|nr:AAA family ATPase [bacterium]